MHSGQILIGARRGIPIWMPLPQSRQGPHRLIQPYTRRNWNRWPVKEAETLLSKHTESGLRLYFVRLVNRS
jgi:hypothetical protein